MTMGPLGTRVRDMERTAVQTSPGQRAPMLQSAWHRFHAASFSTRARGAQNGVLERAWGCVGKRAPSIASAPQANIVVVRPHRPTGRVKPSMDDRLGDRHSKHEARHVLAAPPQPSPCGAFKHIDGGPGTRAKSKQKDHRSRSRDKQQKNNQQSPSRGRAAPLSTGQQKQQPRSTPPVSPPTITHGHHHCAPWSLNSTSPCTPM